MIEKIKELLEAENIFLYTFCPLENCKITKQYLLDKAEINEGFAVIFAIPYYTHACEESPNISAYAVGRDYHFYVKELEGRLIPKLKESFGDIKFALFADHSPIDERDAAARSGLGIFGKNRLLITEKYSSYIFLSELIVGARLPDGYYTEKETEYCENCGLCQKACPWLRGESHECLSALTQKKGELDKDEKELAFVRDLEEIDADSRKALEECFKEYYMIPVITKVLECEDKFGTLKWRVETDRGEITFNIKNRHSDIKHFYGTNRVIIRDSNDNRYEIKDYKALDAHSQRLLFSYL